MSEIIKTEPLVDALAAEVKTRIMTAWQEQYPANFAVIGPIVSNALGRVVMNATAGDLNALLGKLSGTNTPEVLTLIYSSMTVEEHLAAKKQLVKVEAANAQTSYDAIHLPETVMKWIIVTGLEVALNALRFRGQAKGA